MRKRIFSQLSRIGSLFIGVGNLLHRKYAVDEISLTKIQLKEMQTQVCREYLAAHPELSNIMTVEAAMRHSTLMGGKDLDANSRSVSLL